MDVIREEKRFSFTGPMPDFEGLRLRDIGWECTPPLHQYGPAVREYWLIHFVLSGKGTFTVAPGREETRRAVLSAGDCFLIAPRELTCYTADSLAPWEYLWLGYEGGDGERLTHEAFGFAASGTGRFDTAAGARAKEQLLRVQAGSLPIGLRFFACLYDLLASVKERISPAVPHRPDIVAAAVTYIENNYFRPFDITVLSRELGISRAYFTTLFTRTTGSSPYRYLLRYRLNKAAELLTETELTVTEVGYSVGFSGVERFSEMFKHEMGLSPLAYRRRNRAEPLIL